MSLPWRAELRVGLCPERLVLADAAQAVSDPLVELSRIAAGRRVSVVLSSHFVRFALIPWSEALGSEEEWHALARHSFAATYGHAADGWHVCVSPAGRGEARVASAIDGPLLESLRAIPSVVSVQPYLMTAFNARRRALGKRDGWFVVREPGRATLALIRNREWRLVRTRRVGEDWPALAEVLERENAAARDDACDDAFLFCDQEAPDCLGRFRVTDLTLPKGARGARTGAMAWH